MSAASKQETVGIKSQFMTEIIMYIFAIGTFHKKVFVTLWHWVNLGDMGNDMNAFGYLTGLVYQDKSVFVYLRPLRGNAMQIPSPGKELTAHGIG
jgi:hypothetical protein